MDKHVLAISFRLALCRVEKLHGYLKAHELSFPNRRGWPAKRAARPARQRKSGERQMPEGESETAAREAYSRVENTGF